MNIDDLFLSESDALNLVHEAYEIKKITQSRNTNDKFVIFPKIINGKFVGSYIVNKPIELTSIV